MIGDHGLAAVLLAFSGLCAAQCMSSASAAGATDSRIRTVVYAPDEVYRLRGYAGYQVDLEFEVGEAFLGLGAGDVESLTFGAQANHLFLKPRASGIATNLTVITDRRTYHFDYQASDRRPDPALGDVVYVLRFVYAPSPQAEPAAALEGGFVQAVAARPHNLQYGYRGSSALKPIAAWDDGVQTHLSFGSRQELPAIFVRNEDQSESLVNFTVEADEVVVHRVVRELQVRRGALAGCIVNEAFGGGGERLPSGTIAPGIERDPRVRP
ncbi:MAG: TrbG/VirB9 family P-type conjugative transfer protein [Proteobacteria bacterium]|nr:TrbG/VirB9 family P-type conjugative transfer protein [Pseudomonadota bacterium]